MYSQVIAIDWSGAVIGAEKRIWLAEAKHPGQLTRLESGRSRAQLTDHLLDYLQHRPDTVIGLDFAFSFPRWYLDELQVTTAHELWAHVATHGDAWLRQCEAPFWGRGPGPRPSIAGPHYRACEAALMSTGLRPKSIFQIGGAGAVGTGSIRGMPLLQRLHQAGASIWPFDPPGLPLILEIYPRLCTGPVVKSSAAARAAYLALHAPGLDPVFAASASGSEDAFDAAVSALTMAQHDFGHLPGGEDPLEGAIWRPSALR